MNKRSNFVLTKHGSRVTCHSTFKNQVQAVIKDNRLGSLQLISCMTLNLTSADHCLELTSMRLSPLASAAKVFQQMQP